MAAITFTIVLGIVLSRWMGYRIFFRLLMGGAVGLCPERTRRLMDVLRREVASGRLPGAVAMIARRGQIGMFEAVGQPPPEQQYRIAAPFAHDPDAGVPMKVLEPRQVPAMEGGGGGLMSTAMDYTRFLQCLRNRGQLGGVHLLGPHTVDCMTDDH